MQVFTLTLQQMALLFTFIAIGYIVAKLKVVPDNAGAVLSKLENNVFTPASILGTFITGFTVAKLSSQAASLAKRSSVAQVSSTGISARFL